MFRPAVALVVLSCMIVGCGGGGDGPAAEQLLPEQLAGATLRREEFTGSEWLAAGTERFVQPELRLDVVKFLTLLDRDSSDLTVAWALAPDGPKVITYRVREAADRRLIRAYADSVSVNPRTAETVVAGKHVTVATGPTSTRRGYLYAHNGVLYVAGSDHVDPRELRELMSKLP
jgi:hypothetical protein